jgi:TPR repeat protein
MKHKLLIQLTIFCCFGFISKAQQLVHNDLLNQAQKYQYGIGVVKDEKMAFSLYLQAALNGNKQAMNRVGVFYKEGIGTIANSTFAKQWLLKSG